VDVTLADTLQVMRDGGVLDPRQDCAQEFKAVMIDDGGFDIEPGWFVLGSTVEVFTLGERLVGKLEMLPPSLH
jgi:deoxycytidine triphosphate deaminase